MSEISGEPTSAEHRILDYLDSDALRARAFLVKAIAQPDKPISHEATEVIARCAHPASRKLIDEDIVASVYGDENDRLALTPQAQMAIALVESTANDKDEKTHRLRLIMWWEQLGRLESATDFLSNNPGTEAVA